jgi:hypothetical protein
MQYGVYVTILSSLLYVYIRHNILGDLWKILLFRTAPDTSLYSTTRHVTVYYICVYHGDAGRPFLMVRTLGCSNPNMLQTFGVRRAHIDSLCAKLCEDVQHSYY